MKFQVVPEWREVVFSTYKDCRKFIGWKTIYSLHEKEERDYFDMLDEFVAKGKMKINFTEDK